MNEEIKKTLKENALEYFRNALNAEEKEEYNTSVTLFFKAISALCDLYILISKNQMPSNHAERFRILEQNYPEIYKLIDSAFPIYQESYRAKLNKFVSERMKNGAEKLFKLLDIRV